MSNIQPFTYDSVTGQPFESETLAIAQFRKEGRDKSKEAVVPHKGGYAIVNIAALAEIVSTPPSVQQPTEKPMKYWVVNFNQRQSANEVQAIPLSLNGLELRIQRGVDVCLPESFIEIAEHASMTNWDTRTGDPSIPVKASGTIFRFPFRRVREASEEEFKKDLANGNSITNEFMERLKRK
jgi:hypothetical protein